MIRKLLKIFLVFTFYFFLLQSGYSQVVTESDTVIINSINVKTETGEIPAESVDFKDAANWAYNAHLNLVPDAPPVIDNKAFFITQYQTVIPVTGYKRELLYRVNFDFLRYTQSMIPYNTKLKIFIKDIYGNKRQVGTADVTCMSDKKRFEVLVPFDLSYPGRFYIIIQEYAEKTGNWGIWDIIVTSKKIDELEIMPIDSPAKINEIEPKIFK